MRPRRPAARTRRAYLWTGIDAAGRSQQGHARGRSEHELRLELRQRGIRPRSVEPVSWQWRPGPRSPRIGSADVAVFLRLLATMLAAGLPLAQALSLVAERQRQPGWLALIKGLQARIEAGEPLAAAMARYPDSFGGLVIRLVDAGEKSGNLDATLARVALYQEKLEALRKRLGKALLYPAAVLVVAALVAGILLYFVVPKFQLMFQGFGADLPAFTNLVIAMSDALRGAGAEGLGVTIALFFCMAFVWRRSQRLRHWGEAVALRLPVIGGLLGDAALARMHRTLATLCAAGVPLVDALDAAGGVAGRRRFETAMASVRDAVETGTDLQSAMRGQPVFPVIAVQMVAVGEASGTLDSMCARVAEHFETEVEGRVDALSSLIEPAIMLVVGGLVGGLVIAMYLPIFQIGGVMG